ncbi:MAG TPA: DinB family protein [Dehalococcoidia bacterium]|nr:DinB family protein [Dehalococcoidia bacterium]
MVTQDIVERVVSYIKHQAEKPNDAIIDLVSRNQVRLLDVMERVDDELASRAPAPGEWSVRELLAHVISAEAGVARLVEMLARGHAPQREATPGEKPDDQRPFREMVASLRATNEALLRAIRQLPPEPDLETTAPHPFFGQLNCKQWAVFQRVHDEDHIQHANKIIAAVSG